MESEKTDIPVPEFDEPDKNVNTEANKETNENEGSPLPEETPGITKLDENLSLAAKSLPSLSTTEEEEDEDEEGSKVPKHPYGDNYDPITAKHIKQTAIRLGIIKLSWPPLEAMLFER